VAPLDAKSFTVTAVARSNVKGPAKGTIRLDVPGGWRVTPAAAEFSTAADGQSQPASFTVTPANLAEKTYEITAVAEYSGKHYREGYDITGYAGVRPYYLYRSATYKTSGVDVKIEKELEAGCEPAAEKFLAPGSEHQAQGDRRIERRRRVRLAAARLLFDGHRRRCGVHHERTTTELRSHDAGDESHHSTLEAGRSRRNGKDLANDDIDVIFA
jgi:hypothetical protein